MSAYRVIRKYGIETPLIVPSFSSTIYEKTGKIHSSLKEHLYKSSLISAYDLSHNYIDIDDIWVSDIVFLDSGNYELRARELRV